MSKCPPEQQTTHKTNHKSRNAAEGGILEAALIGTKVAIIISNHPPTMTVIIEDQGKAKSAPWSFQKELYRDLWNPTATKTPFKIPSNPTHETSTKKVAVTILLRYPNARSIPIVFLLSDTERTVTTPIPAI